LTSITVMASGSPPRPANRSTARREAQSARVRRVRAQPPSRKVGAPASSFARAQIHPPGNVRRSPFANTVSSEASLSPGETGDRPRARMRHYGLTAVRAMCARHRQARKAGACARKTARRRRAGRFGIRCRRRSAGSEPHRKSRDVSQISREARLRREPLAQSRRAIPSAA